MLSEYQRDYVREQSVGEIIRNTFEIYKSFFSELFLPCLLIIGIPVILWNYVGEDFFRWADSTNNFVGISIVLFTTMLASAVLTVVVSDICLGNYPKVGQAIGFISPKHWGKLLVTNVMYYLLALLLLYLFMEIGALLWILGLLGRIFAGVDRYIVDYIIFPLVFRTLALLVSIMLIFYPAIVVLEGRWGFNAFKRSVTLGWGYHLRNYGAQFVLLFLTYVVSVITGVLLTFLSLKAESIYPRVILGLIAYVINLILTPLNIICLVLLYYDMRVRKEAYNNSALALELRH